MKRGILEGTPHPGAPSFPQVCSPPRSSLFAPPKLPGPSLPCPHPPVPVSRDSRVRRLSACRGTFPLARPAPLSPPLNLAGLPGPGGRRPSGAAQPKVAEARRAQPAGLFRRQHLPQASSRPTAPPPRSLRAVNSLVTISGRAPPRDRAPAGPLAGRLTLGSGLGRWGYAARRAHSRAVNLWSQSQAAPRPEAPPPRGGGPGA